MPVNRIYVPLMLMFIVAGFMVAHGSPNRTDSSAPVFEAAGPDDSATNAAVRDAALAAADEVELVFAGEDEEEPDEDGEEEEGDLEEHHFHLEIEKAELEVSFGRFEMVRRMAEIAESELATASFAVMHVHEFFEEPEQVAEFLAGTGLLFHLFQKTDIGEIDFLEPAEIEQVDDDGDGQCGQGI